MEERADIAPGADFRSFETCLDSLNVEGYVDRAVQEAKEKRSNGEQAVVECWRHRGCEGLMGLVNPMEQECPHNRTDCYSPCPAECQYTACVRPWHKQCTDFNLILDETVDRKAAYKKACYTCEYFLTNAPRLSDQSSSNEIIPDTATRDSDSAVTIHLF